MAGSYNHLLGGFRLIENLGDANEAMCELLWLVERGIGRANAKALLDDEYHPMMRGERPADVHFEFVNRVQGE